MRRHCQLAVLAVGALALIATQSCTAFARTRHPVVHHRIYSSDEAPPLTVTPRSFLDPGPVVPYGSTDRYVIDSTILNQTPDAYLPVTHFGGWENLPNPLSTPGRQEPLFEFSTGTGGP